MKKHRTSSVESGKSAVRRNLLERVDPTTRILGLILWTTPLLLSIDWVSATVSLLLTVCFAPLCGVGLGKLARRGWPLLLLAPLSGLGMVLYGRAGGQEYFSWGPIAVTENSVGLAIAVMIRVLAVGLPAVVFVAGIDPTRLGDGLAQLWKLPARFVIGTVAGVRMASLFQRDWHSLDRARRARGMGDRSALVKLPQQAFTLLVLALRRAGKLATAMEARGFGSSVSSTRGAALGAAARANAAVVQRTWAREAHFGQWDIMLLIICVLASALSLGVAVLTGDFRLLGVAGA